MLLEGEPKCTTEELSISSLRSRYQVASIKKIVTVIVIVPAITILDVIKKINTYNKTIVFSFLSL